MVGPPGSNIQCMNADPLFAAISYKVDEGLCGQNVLQLINAAMYMLIKICSPVNVNHEVFQVRIFVAILWTYT